MGECPFQLPTLSSHTPFNMADFTMDEVRAVVTKTRAASAPRPSGTTYKIYKCCPLEEALKALMNTVEEEAGTRALDSCCGLLRAKRAQFHKTLPVPGDLPPGCRGENLLVHHRQKTNNILLTNEFINPSVQKGGVPGYSGCLEHTTEISQHINEAKRHNNTLSVVWLDLTKAYPSVPHQLIRKALDQYQVPSEVIELVMAHMGALQMRFTAGRVTTKWQRLDKGIMAGCTVSVVLFIAAMNLLLMAGEMQCRGLKADDGTRHPACRAFMDNVTVMTPCIQGTQWILSALEKRATWSRLQFKPEKSRSLSILTGNTFSFQGAEIPTIQDQRIQCLGKQYDSSLNDSDNLASNKAQLNTWLKAVEHSQLLRRFKVWCFQYGILPRLQWPFLLYEFPMSQVEGMERLCSKFLQK